jgi:3'(2'), 5'-bisphosphate nucleotidase
MGPSLANPTAMTRVAEIADAAGLAAMRFYGRSAGAQTKGDGSPVTEADRAAHDVIISALSRLTPGVPVVSEEADVPSFEERRRWNRFWLVDPLDGTKEFIAANGEFTVNIALIENGTPVLGVVAAPALSTTYVAASGFGSWRHDGSEPPSRLESQDSQPAGITRVVVSRSHPSPRLESFLTSLGSVERIPLGSSLKFCRVAEGSADIYPRFGRTMEWDVAAGDCVFRNSGSHRAHRSPLCYNQETLSTAEFVIDGR